MVDFGNGERKGKETREKSSSPLAVERSQPGSKNKYAARLGRPNFISSGEMLELYVFSRQKARSIERAFCFGANLFFIAYCGCG